MPTDIRRTIFDQIDPPKPFRIKPKPHRTLAGLAQRQRQPIRLNKLQRALARLATRPTLLINKRQRDHARREELVNPFQPSVIRPRRSRVRRQRRNRRINPSPIPTSTTARTTTTQHNQRYQQNNHPRHRIRPHDSNARTIHDAPPRSTPPASPPPSPSASGSAITTSSAPAKAAASSGDKPGSATSINAGPSPAGGGFATPR